MKSSMKGIIDKTEENILSYEPADIIIHIQGRGIVVKEKSVIAFRKNDCKILAFGTEAERMKGTDTENIVIMSPLRQGMVVDFTVAAKLFSLLLTKALGKGPFLKRYAVAVCVPKGITPVEKKTIWDAMVIAFASEVFMVDIPIERFIREFPEKFPDEYRKFKIIIGITKDEPERYVEERLRETVTYAGDEQISGDRVSELLRGITEQE